MDNKKYYFAMMKVDDKYYILCNKDGSLNPCNTKEAMIMEFEAMYELANRRGYKNNYSAIIHNCMFQPSVINMSIEEISDQLFDLKSGTKVHNVRADNGGFLGLCCNSDKNLDEIFESGVKPRLGLE